MGASQATYDARQHAARAATTPPRHSTPHWWFCNVCHEQNSRDDGECQWCECGGIDCARDACSDPRHFAPEATP